MKRYERIRSLLRSPKVAWDVILRGRYNFVFDQMPISMRGMSVAKRCNLVKAGMNLIYRRLAPWSMPLHLQVELTNYCDLRCPICPTGLGAMKRTPKAMDIGLLERLVDEVGPYLLTCALWAWGEPLLHPQLSRVLQVMKKHKIATLLSTNGQRLTDDGVVQALLEFPPTHLIVAIDGLTEETHSVYRSGARLEPVLEGVRRLANIKKQKAKTWPILHMRYMVMRHNQHEVPRLKEFARKCGFDLLTVRTLSVIDAESPDAMVAEFIPDMCEFKAYGYENGARIRRNDDICQHPFWFPSVLADGTVTACDQDYNGQVPLGALTQGVSFKKLWFSRKAGCVRKAIRDDPDAFRFCVNCPYRDRSVTDCSVQRVPINLELPSSAVIA